MHNRCLVGRITVVQEQRFRLTTNDGRSFLFILDRKSPVQLPAVYRLRGSHTLVRIEYSGEPNTNSGIAHIVQPIDDNLRGSLMASFNKATSREEFFSAFRNWPIPKQLAGEDPKCTAAQSELSRKLRPRLEEADRVGTSICPYCAVGCAQLIYAKGNDVIHIEGDPRSPINQGTLCPKGAATFGWMTSQQRINHVLYRAPHSLRWEQKPLDWAMDRIAALVKKTRDETFVETLPGGETVNHTLGIGSLGGATLDNEENYLIKKLFSGGLGMVWIENQ